MIGTIAYAALVTVVLGLLLFAATRRRVSAWLAWPLGLAFCWGVELWQVTGVPARLSSQWLGWRLTLGTTFDWRDVALYPVGVALAALALWAVPALRGRTSPISGGLPRLVLAGAGALLFWGAYLAWPSWLALTWDAAWHQPPPQELGTAPAHFLGPLTNQNEPAFEAPAQATIDAARSVVATLATANGATASLGLLAVAGLVLWVWTRQPRPSRLSARRLAALRVVGALSAPAAWSLIAAWFSGWGFWPVVFGAAAHALVVARVAGGDRPGRGAWARALTTVALTPLALALNLVLLIVVQGLGARIAGGGQPAPWAGPVSAAVVLAGAAISGWWLSRAMEPPGDADPDTTGSTAPGPATASSATPLTAPGAHSAPTAGPAARAMAVGLVAPLALTLGLLSWQCVDDARGERVGYERALTTLHQDGYPSEAHEFVPRPGVSPAPTDARSAAAASPSGTAGEAPRPTNAAEASPRPSPTAIVPPPPGPTPTAAPGATAEATQPCAASDLRFELVGIDRVMGGNGYGILQAINMGTEPCWLAGRPVLSVAQGGRLLEITSGRPEAAAPDGDGARVSLVPGQRAETTLGWRGYGAADHETEQQQTLMVSLGKGSSPVPAATLLAVDDGYTPPPQASLHPFDLVKGGHLGTSTWGTVGQNRQ